MSENIRFYVVKMAERRRRSAPSWELCADLKELLAVVARCEAMWDLEDRIEKSR